MCLSLCVCVCVRSRVFGTHLLPAYQTTNPEGSKALAIAYLCRRGRSPFVTRQEAVLFYSLGRLYSVLTPFNRWISLQLHIPTIATMSDERYATGVKARESDRGGGSAENTEGTGCWALGAGIHISHAR